MKDKKERLFAIQNLEVLDKDKLVELLKKKIDNDNLTVWEFLYNARLPL